LVFFRIVIFKIKIILIELSSLFAEDIDIKFTGEHVLLVNLDHRFGASVGLTLSFGFLLFSDFLLNIIDLAGGFSELVGADNKGTKTEAAGSK
jgi:hypothetical protein